MKPTKPDAKSKLESRRAAVQAIELKIMDAEMKGVYVIVEPKLDRATIADLARNDIAAKKQTGKPGYRVYRQAASTVEDQWESYVNELSLFDTPAPELSDMRELFFAGFAAAFETFTAALYAIPEEDVPERVGAYSDELDAHAEELYQAERKTWAKRHAGKS